MLIQFCYSLSFGQTAIIQGFIHGIGTDTIFIKRGTALGRYPAEDTLIAKDGNFKYLLKCEEATFLTLLPKKTQTQLLTVNLTYTPDSKKIVLLVKPNDTITISGTLEKFRMDYTVKGSKICEDINKYWKSNSDVNIKHFKAELEIEPLLVENKEKDRIQKLIYTQVSLRNIVRKKECDSIENSTNRDLAAFLLLYFPSPEILAKYLNTFSAEEQNGMLKKYFLEVGNKYRNYVASEAQNNKLSDSFAPDFSLKSYQGENFVLSKLKGKFVVLDFWGTWCSPCIKGLPKMKEYYSKYKADVVFVGIACNDKEHKWREYLGKNELPWINLLNNENEVPNVSSLYGASSLPTKVIIDPEGKIVATIKGESEEFYEILDKTIPTAQKSTN